ncbi:hypothetical protein BGI50_20165 [Burkholderia pseudomallei]|nr:hypothetical protein BGI50_20165 [Burkholderia pseudomallei]OMO08740.1 hypothetical protein BGI48_20310 [Burkholderia pseudomallei]
MRRGGGEASRRPSPDNRPDARQARRMRSCGAMRAPGAHASGNRRPSARRHAAGASARARRVSAGR